ncbi:MAG: hypothetical protein JJU46_09845 [Balneolaceae bacterium]|nr:hypothetical protein [Balneolaceae bacterium]MCH8547762.1 hypothetical protein [Balneolaceae bacterium]
MKARINLFPALLIISLFFTGCTVTGRVIIQPEPVIIDVSKPKVVHKKKGAVPRSQQGRKATTQVKVPRGHMPPPGKCRVWYSDRPPGHQPPVMECHRIRRVPSNAVIIRG